MLAVSNHTPVALDWQEALGGSLMEKYNIIINSA